MNTVYHKIKLTIIKIYLSSWENKNTVYKYTSWSLCVVDPVALVILKEKLYIYKY